MRLWLIGLMTLALTGCAGLQLDLLSGNKIVAANQIVTSRSTVAKDASVDLTMQGGGTVEAAVIVPKEAVLGEQSQDATLRVRILSDNEIGTKNQLGTSRSVQADGGAVKYSMEGGGTAKPSLELK